jgi:hypothetical protein
MQKCFDPRLKAGYFQPVKIANQSRPRKQELRFQSPVTLTTAKTYLGRLIDKAAKGEAVYILKGGHRFILQAVPDIDPIPMRPPGYFAGCYTKAEIQEDNLLAKASIVRAPEDLE